MVPGCCRVRSTATDVGSPPCSPLCNTNTAKGQAGTDFDKQQTHGPGEDSFTMTRECVAFLRYRPPLCDSAVPGSLTANAATSECGTNSNEQSLLSNSECGSGNDCTRKLLAGPMPCSATVAVSNRSWSDQNESGKALEGRKCTPAD